jgi:hypothetical protein
LFFGSSKFSLFSLPFCVKEGAECSVLLGDLCAELSICLVELLLFFHELCNQILVFSSGSYGFGVLVESFRTLFLFGVELLPFLLDSVNSNHFSLLECSFRSSLSSLRKFTFGIFSNSDIDFKFFL